MHDLHIKDISQTTPKGKTVPVGRGVLDIVGLLKGLVERKFPYHVGLEYEAQENDPQPGVLESVGYMRGALAAI
jgi:sugar phosphate isomerase/epimerase